eukprot:TRINITY_DN3464_c1_g2_i2.p1 TRINITY_DN3464_c1_g2~~TRINITY_DN3464_c1_g2_i2.p1  ORF type:complete len:154 (+),score=17.42 TRINITY_DN3464_c1_g2_i2:336-797(+)
MFFLGHSHGNYFCRYYDNDCDGCVSDYSGGDCVYCDGICLGRINNVQDIYKMECSSSCDNGLFEMSYLYGLAIVVGFILLVSFSTLIWRSKQFRKYHKEDNKSSNIERGVGFSRAPISISRNMQLQQQTPYHQPQNLQTQAAVPTMTLHSTSI